MPLYVAGLILWEALEMNEDGFYDWNFKFSAGGFDLNALRKKVMSFQRIELFQHNYGIPIKYRIDSEITPVCIKISATERTYQLINIHNFIGAN